MYDKIAPFFISLVDLQGSGQRTGGGTCSCHDGFEGELCDECSDGYFSETDENGKPTCTGNLGEINNFFPEIKVYNCETPKVSFFHFLLF